MTPTIFETSIRPLILLGRNYVSARENSVAGRRFDKPLKFHNDYSALCRHKVGVALTQRHTYILRWKLQKHINYIYLANSWFNLLKGVATCESYDTHHPTTCPPIQLPWRAAYTAMQITGVGVGERQ